MTTPPTDDPAVPPTATPAGGQPPPAFPPRGYTGPPREYGAPPLGPPPGYPAAPPPGYGFPPGQSPPGGYPLRRPAPVSPAGRPLAEFPERLLARLVDTLLLATVLLIVTVPLILLVFASVIDDIQLAADGSVRDPDVFALVLPWLLLSAGIVVLALAATYLYEVEYQRRTGQTLGKKITNIRVAPLDPAARFDRAMAARRWLLGSVASGLIPGLTYVDGLWQLWDQPYRQCLHDKFARTVVEKVPG